MAITKMMNIKGNTHGGGQHLFNSIRYIMNPDKTDGGLLVGGNSGNDCYEVYETMLNTKQDWSKLDGRQGYHFVISWKPGEINEETAYQIIQEFCEEYLGDNYDYVFSVHNDQKHMHGHVVFNSVNRNTGYKYRYIKGDWEKVIQPITDRVCERHGLKKLEYDREKRTGRSYAEWQAEKDGKFIWKKIIRSDIDYVISCSDSWENFQEQMKMLGYHIKSGHSNKRGEDFMSFCAPGQGRAWRDYNLGEGYKVSDIKRRILKETFQYDFPKAPKVKRCKIKPVVRNYPYLSRYQVRKVRMLRQTSNYLTKRNPYAVNPAQVRKNLLQIDRLHEDCAYLLRRGIKNESELEIREEEILKEEKILKEQQGNRYWILDEEEYQRYVKLQEELQALSDWDDRFEELLDQLEELESKLPADIDEVGARFQMAKERLSMVRQEKRIIRHVKKMDKQMISTPLIPGKEIRDMRYKKINAEKERGVEAWRTK